MSVRCRTVLGMQGWIKRPYRELWQYIMYVCVCESLCCVWLFVTPWTVAHQAPLSMGFSRQEYCSGLPFPSPGNLPDPRIEPGSPALQVDFLPSEPPEKPYKDPPKVCVLQDWKAGKITDTGIHMMFLAFTVSRFVFFFSFPPSLSLTVRTEVQTVVHPKATCWLLGPRRTPIHLLAWLALYTNSIKIKENRQIFRSMELCREWKLLWSGQCSRLACWLHTPLETKNVPLSLWVISEMDPGSCSRVSVLISASESRAPWRHYQNVLSSLWLPVPGNSTCPRILGGKEGNISSPLWEQRYWLFQPFRQPRGMGWGGRRVGSSGSGDTCTLMADSCWCMAKTTTRL